VKLTSFTQNLPAGEGQADVPALLRRIADTLEGRGDVHVEDIVYYVEITAEGEWPRMRVYYSTDED